MADGDLLGTSATQLIATVGAIGALGTAAFGLVDATKAFGGGVANVGFPLVLRAVEPFAPAFTQAVGPDWQAILLAHWRNGKPKPEQKAIATALIQLGLTPETALAVAPYGHVLPDALAAVVDKLMKGEELDAAELNVIGRFRTSIEARMDAAFEQAEQRYRNVARVLAGLVAVMLAVFGGGLIARDMSPASFTWSGYWLSFTFGQAFLVGLVAVPVAPITKDLIGSLSAAVRAVKSARTP